jgi:hypothetical protein
MLTSTPDGSGNLLPDDGQPLGGRQLLEFFQISVCVILPPSRHPF